MFSLAKFMHKPRKL